MGLWFEVKLQGILSLTEVSVTQAFGYRVLWLSLENRLGNL